MWCKNDSMPPRKHFDATGRPSKELFDWLAHCRAFGLPAIVVAHPPGRMRIAVDGVEVFNGDPARGREVLAELEAQPRRVTRPARPKPAGGWDIPEMPWREDQEARNDDE